MYKAHYFKQDEAVGEPGGATQPAADSAAVAESKAKIVAKYNKAVAFKPFKFHFKKDDLGNKRATVELNLPVVTIEGIVGILESGDAKQQGLLLSCIEDVITSQARNILNDAGNEAMTAETFPLDQCTFEAIANLPDAEKRGRGIAKEVWEEFAADYLSTMPALTGKKQEAIELAVKLFITKYSTIKTNKPVLKKLQGELAIYTNGSPNAEQFSECIKFLNEKAQTLIDTDETALLANL